MHEDFRNLINRSVTGCKLLFCSLFFIIALYGKIQIMNICGYSIMIVLTVKYLRERLFADNSEMIHIPCLHNRDYGVNTPERSNPWMNKKNTAVLLSAAVCGILMTGCDSDRNTMQAEQKRPAASAVTERTAEATETDRNHSLYEEDDIHRKTDRNEPDLIDRADSALDSVEEAVTSLLTDAKEKLDDMN